MGVHKLRHSVWQDSPDSPICLRVSKNGRPVSGSVALMYAKKLYPDKEWEIVTYLGDENSRGCRGRVREIVKEN